DVALVGSSGGLALALGVHEPLLEDPEHLARLGGQLVEVLATALGVGDLVQQVLDLVGHSFDLLGDVLGSLVLGSWDAWGSNPAKHQARPELLSSSWS